MSEKVLFKQIYKKPYPVLRGEVRLACISKGFEVAEVRLMALGKIQRDADTLEYIDVRVFTRKCVV
jgi:hypothetical protein